jgi:iron complex outermembrane receptor protein
MNNKMMITMNTRCTLHNSPHRARQPDAARARHPLARMINALACSALPVALCVPPASAQVLEEVFVTAQKRTENIQETPISISAFQGDALDAYRITSFDDIAKASPSITFSPYPTSNNLLIMFIRGQGVGDPAQITIDGSVGIYQDGFYISRPQGSTFDLADLERVEVLRGPQGTLYGRNTTGGAVNLISRRPSGEFGFKQDVTFGSRDEFRSLSIVDLPQWNGLSAKASVLTSTIDGFVENPGAGEDFGLEEQLAGRFDLNWQISRTLTADLLWESGNLDSSPNYYQNPAWNGREITAEGSTNTYHEDAGERRRVAYREFDLNKSTTEYDTYGLTLNWDINDSLTLKSLTGYRELEWRAFQNFAEALGFISTTDPDFFLQPLPITFISDNGVEGDQFSQELTLIGNPDDSSISFVAGLYYFEENNDSRGFGEQAALGTSNMISRFVTAESESYAAYGQVTWTPSIVEERLSVTVGARYTADTRKATRDLFTVVDGVLDESRSQEGASNDDDYDKFNPSLTLAFDWTDEVNAYLRIATGYKAGGSSESAPVDLFDDTVAPENVVSYELGMKSYWFDRRLRANLAVFESQFDDMQFAFAVDPSDASIVQSYNAGEATIRGLEADLVFQALDNLALSVQYAYLDPDLEEVEALAGTIFDPATNPAAEGFSAVGDNIADSFTIPYAPDHSLLLAADTTLYSSGNLTVRAHLDYRYQSATFAGTTAGDTVPGRNNLKIDSYGVYNARIALGYEFERGDMLEIALWGQNIFDEKYPAQVIGLGSIAPTQNQLGEVIYGYVQQATIWTEPARFGVDLSYRF